MGQRVLVVGLDGWDHGYERRLRAGGDLRTITALSERSARFLIDPQGLQLDGLDWEHFLAGAGAEATHRTCAVDFDPTDYAAWQRSAGVVPFFDGLPVRSVVVDVPYLDLARSPSTRGVVGWAASDPGVAGTQARPESLTGWIDAEVGAYPATDWLDAVAWPSVDDTVAMGRHLVRGVATRQAAAAGVLTEHTPEWDLAMVVVTETHTAAEAFWHGVDPAHPLHGHPSAPAAAAAMRDVYSATDDLIESLVASTGADRVVLLALNGMASNRFDVPTMVLLPELLLRWSCGEQQLHVPDAWTRHPGAVPLLPAAGPSWGEACRTWLGMPSARSSPLKDVLRRARGRLTHQAARHDGERSEPAGTPQLTAPVRIPIGWHPAMHYQPWWPRMRAFALPSFAAGHVRVNVAGRERDGVVDPADYERVCDELEELLRACTNPATGASVVESVHRPHPTSPHGIDRAAADLRVTWAEGVCGFEHVDLGLVGPVPFRRTGDHMGTGGFASFSGRGVASGDRGPCTVFDLAPTITALAGATPSAALAGRNLLAAHE